MNGAVRYEFSSIVTPAAVLWYSNKVLNPGLVSVEVATVPQRLHRMTRPATGPLSKGRRFRGPGRSQAPPSTERTAWPRCGFGKEQ